MWLRKLRVGANSELVTDHINRDRDSDELLAVVYGEVHADKVRHNHGASRPSLDDDMSAVSLSLLHLLPK